MKRNTIAMPYNIVKKKHSYRVLTLLNLTMLIFIFCQPFISFIKTLNQQTWLTFQSMPVAKKFTF